MTFVGNKYFDGKPTLFVKDDQQVHIKQSWLHIKK